MSASDRMTVEVIDCRPTVKRGAAALCLVIRLSPFGMILHDLKVSFRGSKLRVHHPQRPLTIDGVPKVGVTGEAIYRPVISFDSRETGEAFGAAVIAAVRAAHPVALAVIQSDAVSEEP